MYEENRACDVPEGEHGEDVAGVLVDVFEIIGNVDRDEHAACNNSDSSEEPSEHAEKTEERDGVQADFVEEFWFFGVDEWGKPTECARGDLGRGFGADMVLDLGLVDDLTGCG